MVTEIKLTEYNNEAEFRQILHRHSFGEKIV